MTFGAGELNVCAELQKKVPTRTAAGGREPGWVRERDVWIRIRGLSPKLTLEAMAREPRITHEIIARQEDDINPTKRLVIGNRDYQAATVFHSNCDADGSLVDEISGQGLGEQNNPGFDAGGGVLGGARTCPNDEIGVNNQGFSRGVGVDEAFDLTGQKIQKGSILIWHLSELPTSSHVLAEQTGLTEQEKGWHIRSVHDNDGGPGIDLSAAYFFRDNAGADYDWSFSVPSGGGIGIDSFAKWPTNEWMLYGFSWSIADDRTSGWWYSSKGEFFERVTGFAAFGQILNYATRGVVWISGNNSGGTIGGRGMNGNVDHISVLHDLECDQGDVDFFWNGGNARPLAEFEQTGKRFFMIDGTPAEVDERGAFIRMMAVEGVAT